MGVDFSGEWEYTQVRGNNDEFMAKLGVKWALRKLAKTFQYGVGHVSQKIEQNGDTISTTYMGSGKTYTDVATVGVGKQAFKSKEGKTLHRDLKWDGEVLLMDVWTGSGKVVKTKMYLKGDQKITESVLDGTEIQSIYTRKA